MNTKIKEFWRRNQTILFWLPSAFVMLHLVYVWVSSLDSRVGVEGFGDLFGYMLNAVRAAIILFTAWLIKKHLWFDLHASTELDLFQRIRDHGERAAFKLVWKDRFEWIAALSFATYWFTR